ncbi:TetR/AcrR family transcriptional regulator [Alloalcanivorax profundimaris]|uniref:TetR/AcrR family transcriptional regulator n=1 Tax=Alloalcanivorax profundimaris TaxID=2735259 RepID=UPI0018877061|nr:TetR/AcrR family transcriptional regulator [Alloalcanivorax profundimaris]MBF1801928.1 TetR/AcrR family transcriptional regulator [Alloalcanivorax profundimaris]
MSDNDPQTGLRGRPKDPAKRQAILDAAKALFLAQGFSGTSMDAVAAEAGVSKLTVYSHFSDKATLFAAAVEAKCQGLMPFPMFSLESDDALPRVLERIGHAFMELINSEEAIGLERLMTSLASQDPEMARLFFEAGPERTLKEMERLLITAGDQGLLALDDPWGAAELFFGMLQSCRHMQVLIGCAQPPGQAETEAHVREVVRVFLRGYAP